jgi:hypothetical protein
MSAGMAEIQEDMSNVVFLSLDISERLTVARFLSLFVLMQSIMGGAKPKKVGKKLLQPESK